MKRLNPAVKFVCLMVLTFVLAFRHQPILNFAFFALCIVGILSSGTDVKKLLILLSPILLAAVGMFFTGYRFSAGEGMPVNSNDMILTGSHVWNGLIHASRVLAFGGLGMLFAFTTDSMELIMSLMQQFRLPPKFAYGILAAYHFFPVVKEEYAVVGAALQVRGVKAGLCSTRRLFPMLVHALERSESLAMAMESRGFESGSPRAVAFRVELRPVDFLFLFGLNGALLAGLILL